MTKTKLKNVSGSVITLKEGTAGVLRHLCDLEDGEHHDVFYEMNQTYKEYWCIGEGSDQFTLSSDDLIEWKEIVIKAIPASDPKKFEWEGTISSRASAPANTSPSHSSFWSKILPNKVYGLFSKQKPQGTVVTTTITTDPTTTTTTVTTDPATASNTATVAAPTDPATPVATTTVTISTSTTPLATTTSSTTT